MDVKLVGSAHNGRGNADREIGHTKIKQNGQSEMWE